MTNKKVYRTIGASNHSKGEREIHDYYATEPKALELLLDLEKFNSRVWECACGEHHLVNVLENRGYEVKASDILDRLGDDRTEIINFLQFNGRFYGDIITNPPYKYAKEFVEKAIEVIPKGNRVAMLLKLTFLESNSRKELFKNNPPKIIYVASARLSCAKNGDFKKHNNGAICYAWFIWEKGFKGEPVVRWFN